jgi:uncharacterized membrane protein
MRNRETIREYVTGSLWVLPGFSAVLALAVGFILSRIRIDRPDGSQRSTG